MFTVSVELTFGEGTSETTRVWRRKQKLKRINYNEWKKLNELHLHAKMLSLNPNDTINI